LPGWLNITGGWYSLNGIVGVILLPIARFVFRSAFFSVPREQ
jgi:hypothetical protein